MRLLKLVFFFVLVYNSVYIAYLFLRVWAGDGSSIMQESNAAILLVEVIVSSVIAAIAVITLFIKFAKLNDG